MQNYNYCSFTLPAKLAVPYLANEFRPKAEEFAKNPFSTYNHQGFRLRAKAFAKKLFYTYELLKFY